MNGKQLEKRMKRIMAKMDKAVEDYNKLSIVFRGLIESVPAYKGYYDSKFNNNYKNEMFV